MEMDTWHDVEAYFHWIMDIEPETYNYGSTLNKLTSAGGWKMICGVILWNDEC